MSIMRSGRLVMPDNDVTPTAGDIAHNLCRQVRFNGSSAIQYTVMQHTFVVAAQLPIHLRWAALLHDSTEAIMSDVVRPWKPGEFATTEGILLARICRGFALPAPEDWPEEATMLTHEADMMAACAEAILLFGESAKEWCKPWIEPTEQIMADTHSMLPMSTIWMPQPVPAVQKFVRELGDSMQAWKVYISG